MHCARFKKICIKGVSAKMSLLWTFCPLLQVKWYHPTSLNLNTPLRPGSMCKGCIQPIRAHRTNGRKIPRRAWSNGPTRLPCWASPRTLSNLSSCKPLSVKPKKSSPLPWTNYWQNQDSKDPLSRSCSRSKRTSRRQLTLRYSMTKTSFMISASSTKANWRVMTRMKTGCC